MRYASITTDQQLASFCQQISAAERIAFDTEFVSEDRYRPQLCLIQVAAAGQLAVIDTLEVRDVRPFWQLLTDPDRETVVHAGREELLFIFRDIGRFPTRLFDVQVAAGMVGLEYPASYGSLLSKLLNTTLPKGETRTNWRHRPLSSNQIDYALQDVIHLEPLRDELGSRLKRLNRWEWLDDELNSWQNALQQVENSERWRRVSGISGLNSRSLAIVRELWRWRESLAQSRDTPPRRLLRDDLIVELARRQTADRKRIQALRGMERRQLQRYLPDLADAIQTALDLPKDQLPKRPERSQRPQLGLLGQFLAAALGSICRSASIAPSLVGTVQDVRDLVNFRLGVAEFSEPPALATGWRAEVVGKTIDEVLHGRVAIKVARPQDEQQPLEFFPVPEVD